MIMHRITKIRKDKIKERKESRGRGREIEEEERNIEKRRRK